VTSAVVRNGPLTRVGSVTSVEATTSSIAIQVVLIHRLHPPRQEIVKIFFRAMPGEMLGMRHIHYVSRPFEGPLPPAINNRGDPRGEKCERVWCAVCIARIEVKISPEWLKQQRAAELN